jgi:hypothetical protein
VCVNLLLKVKEAKCLMNNLMLIPSARCHLLRLSLMAMTSVTYVYVDMGQEA